MMIVTAGNLSYIEGLLHTVEQHKGYTNDSARKMSLVALECYAARLRELCQASLGVQNNTFARV